MADKSKTSGQHAAATKQISVGSGGQPTQQPVQRVRSVTGTTTSVNATNNAKQTNAASSVKKDASSAVETPKQTPAAAGRPKVGGSTTERHVKGKFRTPSFFQFELAMLREKLTVGEVIEIASRISKYQYANAYVYVEPKRSKSCGRVESGAEKIRIHAGVDS